MKSTKLTFQGLESVSCCGSTWISVEKLILNSDNVVNNTALAHVQRLFVDFGFEIKTPCLIRKQVDALKTNNGQI